MYKEIMCNFHNLYKAYKLAHAGKANDLEVIEFDKNKMHNLNKLLNQLKRKKWDEIFKYYRFKLTEPKERIVDALTFEGRIVQHVLCDNILRPYFEPRLIKENCACRKNKGTNYASNLVKQHMVKFLKTHNDGYCLKMDVHHYFPSMDREVLKGLLMKFPDKEVRNFLFWIIDHSPESNGLPIGNQTSQWFALYYLNQVDRIIKEKYRIKYYTRYMDDLIIIHEDKKYLEKLLNELTIFAKDKLKLEFNGKTQISPLHRGISFLGWKLYYTKDTHKIIKRIDSSKKKFRNKTIKRLKNKYNKGYINNLKYYATAYSFIVNLKKGNTYQYRKHVKAISSKKKIRNIVDNIKKEDLETIKNRLIIQA